jgi:benzodiazapine receptor
MKTYKRYNLLQKPSWAPPAWLFSPVWTFLYILILISFSIVFLMSMRGGIPGFVVFPFILNLIFNFAYTPLEFKVKSNFLASIDVLLVLGTLIWAMIVIWPTAHWVTYMQIPYMLWVSFATVLQLTITYLNRK